MNELKDIAPYLSIIGTIVIYIARIDPILSALKKEVSDLKEEIKMLRQENRSSSDKIIQLEKEVLENNVKHDWINETITGIKKKVGLNGSA